MRMTLKNRWRGLALLGLICISLLSGSRTEASSLIASDKGMHFGVSAASHMACSMITQALTNSKWGSKIGCWMAVNAAGVIKEMTDPLHHGTRDVEDVYANMAGSGISFATLSIAF